MKTRKNITGPHASVHVEHGSNANNSLKSTNTKNSLKPNAKNPHENEKKCITGPHASVHFENGPNAKNG